MGSRRNLADKTKGQNKAVWSTQTARRYAFYQIPGLGIFVMILILVRQWIHLSEWVFWGLILLWVVKDIVLFPFVWRAYERDRLKELHSLIGKEGMVVDRLTPQGYVHVHGELWQAEASVDDRPIEEGEIVSIRGIRGLRLLVEPRR